MMKIGIMGLPAAGKSTLFDTLMNHKSETLNFRNRQETEVGMIYVPDHRLHNLSALFKPRSTVAATIDYIKVPGLEIDLERPSALPIKYLANLKTVDAILIIIRAFKNEMAPHPLLRIDPYADFSFINTELLLSDLAIIENRLERLEKQIRVKPDDKDKKESQFLAQCQQQLLNERPLRELRFSPEELKLLKGFQFLSLKPLLVVLNINESDLHRTNEIIAPFEEFQKDNIAITALCATIEKEIAELAPEDQQPFIEALGIFEPALHKMIRISYELLGLISFFTVGDDECRAWTIRFGDNARRAAGAIHSDLEKGFIRADVVSCSDLLREGSLSSCRSKGLQRLEGKDYVVKDGDIMEIRFNI